MYKGYLKEQDGLKTYPNNTTLLLQHLETGISLAYPENDCYDSVHAAEIYKECIRSANIVIRYGKDTTGVLRAHMIMVLLHSAFGNFEKAEEHAEQFPFRADMTVHKMKSYIDHFKQNHKSEKINCQDGIIFHLEALFDTIIQNGIAQIKLNEYDNALETFTSIFKILNAIFSNEEYQTALHSREKDDVHLLIAEVYTIKGEYEEAVKWLRKMFDYEMNIRTKYKSDIKIISPLVKDSNFMPFSRCHTKKGYLGEMIERFSADRFKPLEGTNSYRTLLMEIKREYQKLV